MRSFPLNTRHSLWLTLAVALGVLSLPERTFAKDKGNKKHGHGNDSKNQHGNDSKNQKSHGNDHDHEDDHDHRTYSSFARSGFTLSLGTGYAGRGYYYGPPNSPYYYERPEVRYYATREAAPREYYEQQGYSSHDTEIAVQRALARAGYYDGSIDGQIGPQSRRSIARYQQSRGLEATGNITPSLLRALGLQ